MASCGCGWSIDYAKPDMTTAIVLVMQHQAGVLEGFPCPIPKDHPDYDPRCDRDDEQEAEG